MKTNFTHDNLLKALHDAGFMSKGSYPSDGGVLFEFQDCTFVVMPPNDPPYYDQDEWDTQLDYIRRMCNYEFTVVANANVIIDFHNGD